MPEERTTAPTTTAQTGTDTAQPLPAQRPPLFASWVGWLLLIGLVAAAAGLGQWSRRRAIRVWQAFAKEQGADFKAKNAFSPALISGTFQERPFMLETALGYEDDAPYYHTRASMPVSNRASFILGLRRKSLLEEAQTRGKSVHATADSKEPVHFQLDDPDFERRFFLACNDTENLTTLLTPEVRSELKRYGDIEIYVRQDVLEWRRAGEVDDLKAIQRLTGLLLEMAQRIEGLPPRRRTLSEHLADNALIEKGV